MIGKITFALAMICATVYGKDHSHHHHVTQQTPTIYDEYFHDCIGCDTKKYYFCGDRNSTHFGKCSSGPLTGCKDTW